MYRRDTCRRYIGPIVRDHLSERRGLPVAKRTDVLELAVLGLLQDSPLHGYELRKRLSTVLGSLRAFSYGSLYPCLKQLLAAGLIVEDTSTPGRGNERSPGSTATAPAGRRSKIVYKLTAEGKEHLQDLLAESGPSAWEDDGFGVHFAFFGRTDAATRLRILEGRRSRLEERMDGFRAAFARTRERLDSYTLELHKHGLESVEREVRWLSELIDDERRREAPGSAEQTPQTPGAGHPAGAPADTRKQS
jgi:DNA-binding PadR family transcriptional regulator